MTPIEDSWSKECHPFSNGKGGIYTVLGHNGLTGILKKYYVHCNVCGEETFSSQKSKLLKGVCCCRCSPKYRRSHSEFKDFFTKYYSDMGFKYLSHETSQGRHTLTLQCKYHLSVFKKQHNGRSPTCSVCNGLEKEGHYNYQGAFRHDLIVGYTGTRSAGKNKILAYRCPSCSYDGLVLNGLCSGVFSITDNDLQRGGCACRCSRCYRYTDPQNIFRAEESARKRFLPHVDFEVSGDILKFICNNHGPQEVNLHKYLKGCGCPACAGKVAREGYINMVTDNGLPTALKFGVSVNATRRIRQQNAKNIFQMTQLCVYVFPTVDACLKAENECKSRLKTGVVSKSDLKDGFTETTYIENIHILKDIFEDCGGRHVRKG